MKWGEIPVKMELNPKEKLKMGETPNESSKMGEYPSRLGENPGENPSNNGTKSQ